jgi:ATP-dependent Zn protease
MVMEFGMSPLGHICVGEGDIIGGELATKIDDATRDLVEKAHATACRIVAERKAALAAIADHLVEVESMDGEELDAWLAAYPPQPMTTAEAPTPARQPAYLPGFSSEMRPASTSESA